MSEDEERRQDPQAGYWTPEFERLPGSDEEDLRHIVRLLREAALPSAFAGRYLNVVNALGLRLRLENETIVLQIDHGSAANVADSFTLAMAPMRVQVAGTAKADSPAGAGSDPAPTETQTIDYQYMAQVLMCVIAWLIMFAIPGLVAQRKLPPEIQGMAGVYDSLIAVFAYPITVAVLAKHKRK